MSRSDSDLAMRRLVAALKATSKSQAQSAASGAVASMEDAVDDGVAEHAAKTQFVHGVGEYYVAKSSHPSQFPRWADILEKPDWVTANPAGSAEDPEHIDGIIDIEWLPIAAPGEASATKILRSDDPRLTFLPYTMQAGETLQAGAYVCVRDSGSGPQVFAAHAGDTFQAAVAYTTTSAGIGSAVDVYFDGANPLAKLTTVPSASDVGKTVFLATTPGYVTLTPPSAPGQLLQPLGRIIEVVSSSAVRVLTAFETQFYL